jgi:F0F1-type ATP synthase membrane subunit b/b'
MPIDKRQNMISISDLKQMIYRETGYRIQVQDNDPILATFYINLATLQEALKHAEHVQNIAKDVINTLPGAANKEMQRAADQVLLSLSAEIGHIAQRIAGDAARAEKANAILTATKWSLFGLLISAIIFGGLGYVVRMWADDARLRSANLMVSEAQEKSDQKIASIKQQTREEIELMRKAIGWLGTEKGMLAKRFFDNGGGIHAATCNSPVWQIYKTKDGNYCVPDRRKLFGGDTNLYGWKLP